MRRVCRLGQQLQQQHEPLPPRIFGQGSEKKMEQVHSLQALLPCSWILRRLQPPLQEPIHGLGHGLLRLWFSNLQADLQDKESASQTSFSVFMQRRRSFENHGDAGRILLGKYIAGTRLEHSSWPQRQRREYCLSHAIVQHYGQSFGSQAETTLDPKVRGLDLRIAGFSSRGMCFWIAVWVQGRPLNNRVQG